MSIGTEKETHFARLAKVSLERDKAELVNAFLVSSLTELLRFGQHPFTKPELLARKTAREAIAQSEESTPCKP